MQEGFLTREALKREPKGRKMPALGERSGLGGWSRRPRVQGAGSRGHCASLSIAEQSGDGAGASSTHSGHSGCSHGGHGGPCPFRAPHGSQEEHKSLFKERLRWRSP